MVTYIEDERNDSRRQNIGLAYGAAFILSIVGFLLWIHQAARNADALGPRGEFSPGWSVGWWFIPVANLWKPLQVMSEIWNRSHPSAMSPHLLWPWWGAWVVGNSAGWLVTWNTFSEGGPITPRALIMLNRTDMVGDILLLVALILAVVLVWQISNAQERRRRELAD